MDGRQRGQPEGVEKYYQQGCEAMSTRLGGAESVEDGWVRESLLSHARGLQGFRLRARGEGSSSIVGKQRVAVI